MATEFDEEAFAEKLNLSFDYWDDADRTIKDTIVALRALPVQQRMAAMVMRPVSAHLYVEAERA